MSGRASGDLQAGDRVASPAARVRLGATICPSRRDTLRTRSVCKRKLVARRPESHLVGMSQKHVSN
jgi:hypothetical protein